MKGCSVAQLTVKSEVGGKVWKIEKRPGESVAADDSILVLECMKMEIPVAAPSRGTVREVLVREGEAVKEGQVLATLDVP
jgi:biotin carboxyl carrier protein